MKFFKKTIFLLLSIWFITLVVYSIRWFSDYLKCQASDTSYVCNQDPIQLVIFESLAILLLALFFIYKFLKANPKDDTFFLFLITRFSRKKEELELKLEESTKSMQEELKDNEKK
tara:strand:- start:153 stop:497 length:345 start_codon:yes stop_codon:yes gene_type:complete